MLKPRFLKETFFLFLMMVIMTTVSFASKQRNFQVQLQSGSFTPSPDIEKFLKDKNAQKINSYEGILYSMIQFYQLPNNQMKVEMKKFGIELGSYIPNNTYYATFSKNIRLKNLENFKVRSIFLLNGQQKLSPQISEGKIPTHIQKEAGKIDVVAFYFPHLLNDKVENELKKLGSVIILSDKANSRITIRIPKDNLISIANLAIIKSIEPIMPQAQVNNFNGRSLHRSNILNYGLGRNLTGNGINVGEVDGGAIDMHVDLKSRLFPFWDIIDNHATHVAGTIAGAGLIDPNGKGMAPKTKLFNWSFYGEPMDTVKAYAGIYKLDITSNSWGYVNYFGWYDYTSRQLDTNALMYPNLLQIFAASNDGPSFNTVSGGPNAAKNGITVGALDKDTIAIFSSKGPVMDGRIKPEICGNGVNVYSTQPGNVYDGFYSGTSMATPGVSGTMAMLYERYEQIYLTKPLNYVMKAIVLNTADDIGNHGPDFTYGFGRINGLKAVKSIENANFDTFSVANGSSISNTFNIPSGVKKAKIMMVYNDQLGASYASKSLVNDLDLMVITPTNDTIFPQVLDTAKITGNSFEGYDSVNNIEQVLIDTIIPGTYTLVVNGYNVPFGPQSFAISYEHLSPTLEITSPLKGDKYSIIKEQLDPTSTFHYVSVPINWEGFDMKDSTTFISFSADGGASWLLVDSVPWYKRDYFYFLPDTSSNKGMIKIQNGSSSSISGLFDIAQTTTIKYNQACASKSIIIWDKVKNSTKYDVLRMSNDSFYLKIASLTDTFFVDSSIISGKQYWYSIVNHDVSGGVSPQSVAKMIEAVGKSCFTQLDAGIELIDSPSNGFCPSSQAIYVKIKNYGSDALTSASIKWRVNGISQIPFVWTGNLKITESDLIKIGTVNLVTGNTYKVGAWTYYPNGTVDKNPYNDSAWTTALEGLSGIYTIGKTGTRDYDSITPALTDLTNKGVCGVVKFEIKDGVYEEQFDLNSVRGNSKVNSVTFLSQSGDSNKVVWQYPASQGGNFLLNINEVSNIHIKDMTLIRTGYTGIGGSRVITYQGNSDNNSIENCVLVTPMNSSTLIYFNSGGFYNNNLIKNNILKHGNYGIIIDGNFGAKSSNNTISDNLIDSSFLTGIYTLNQQNLTIKNNDIINIGSTNSSSSVNGIEMVVCDSNVEISNNVINTLDGYSNYGINAYYNNGDSLNHLKIFNNFIAIDGKTSVFTNGIYDNYNSFIEITSNNVNLYNNTIGIAYFNSNVYTQNEKVVNNNFVNSGLGYAVNLYDTLTYPIFKSNNLYTNGAFIANVNGIDIDTLNNFISATNYTSTLSKDPMYYDSINLHIKNNKLAFIGESGTGILKDIDNDVRLKKPSIGADEIYPPFADAGIQSIDSPFTKNFCFRLGATNIYATINNFGKSSLTSATLNWSVDGVINTSKLWKGSLGTAYASKSILIGGQVFSIGKHIVKVWTSSPNSINDSDATNDTLMITLNIYGKPYTNAGNDTSICIGKSLIIGTGSILKASYLWSNGVKTANQTVSPVLNSTYFLTEKDSNGCINSDTISVIVNSRPKTNIGKDSSVCLGSKISIGNASIKGFTYSWSNGIKTSIQTISPSIKTTYILTEKDINGCENSDSLVIGVNSLPTPNAGIDSSICLGDSAGIGFKGSSSSTYSWSNGAITSSQIVNPSKTTSFYLTETDLNTCSNTDTVTVTVNSLPTPFAGNDTFICSGSSKSIGYIGTKGSSYAWSNSASSSSQIVSPSFKTTYYLLEKNSNGCQAYDSVTIDVKSNPIVLGGNDSTVCSGSATQLMATGSSSLNYIWSNGIKGIKQIVNPKILTTYIVTATDSFGCSSSDTVLRFVNSLPKANAGIDKAICPSDSIIIGDTLIKGYIYNWSNGSKLSNQVVKPSKTSLFYLYVTDANGCNDTDDVLITLNTIPKTFAGRDSILCLGSSINLGDTGISTSKYLWNNGVKTSKQTISVSKDTLLVLSEIDINGCKNSDTIIVKTFKLPKLINGKVILCPQAINILTLPKDSGSTYLWSTGDTTRGITLTQKPGTTKLYKVDILTKNGCNVKDSILLQLNDLQDTTFARKIITVPFGVQFTSNSKNTAKYSWSFGDGSLKDSTSGSVVLHSYPKVLKAKYSISLRMVDSFGCIQTGTDTLTIIGTGIENISDLGKNRFNIYPNPFTESTTISYELTTKSRIKIEMYNLQGQLISKLLDLDQETGKHSFQLKDLDVLPQGSYFINFLNNGEIISKTIIRL